MCPFISCEYSMQDIWAKKASLVFKFSVFVSLQLLLYVQIWKALNSFQILYAGYLGNKGELRVQSLIVGLRKNLRERVADIGGKVVGICVCIVHTHICTCMYVCVYYTYEYMYMYVCLYLYVCINVYIHSKIQFDIWIYVHVCMCVCIIHMNMCICMYVCM